MMDKSLHQFLLLASVLIWLSIPTAMAQGPGGVGGGNLELWLRPQDITNILPATNLTQTWPSVVNNGPNNAVHQGGGTYQIANQINHNYVVSVGSSRFESPIDIGTNDLNVFMVYRLTATNEPLWGNGSGNNRRRLMTHQVHAGGGNTTTYPNGNDIGSVIISNVEIQDGNSSGSTVLINGQNALNYTTNNTTSNNQTFMVGSTDGGNALDGDIAEVIVYDQVLNAGDREKINTYLAIKYGVTLSHDYRLSDNTRIWDISTSYNNNVAGIARDAQSGTFNQPRSRSEEPGAVVTIEHNQATIPDRNALVWGHNNDNFNGTTNFQATDNYLGKGQRVNRVWRVEKTGNFNNFDFFLDNSITLPNNFRDGRMVLLVADDANFTTDLRAFALEENLVQNRYEANGIWFSPGEQFVTIAQCDASLWIRADAANNNVVPGGLRRAVDQTFRLNTLDAANGNEPDFTPGTAADAMNFNPFMEFNQGSTGDYLMRENFIGFDQSAASAFIVLRRSAQGLTNNNENILSYAVTGTNVGNEFVIFNPQDISMVVDEPLPNLFISSAFDITNDRPALYSTIRGGGANTDMYLNGINSIQSGAYKNNINIGAKGALVFGQKQDNPGNGSFNAVQRYKGDLAEVILLNGRASQQEQAIISSYLGIKYGIGLTQDYVSSDNSMIWSTANNPLHTNNITGIGRDDFLSLDQRKSKNQTAIGNDAKVTIEHNGVFSQDRSYIMWGHNGASHDLLLDVNVSPPGFKRYSRVWKVRNPGNKAGTVDIIIERPTLAGNPLSSVRLLVSNQPTLLGPTIYYNVPGPNNTIVFSGVTLNDDTYFALGVTGPFFVNQTQSSTALEACVGDTILIYYGDLPTHPNELKLNGPKIDRDNLLNATVVNNNSYSGVASFVISSSASTGQMRIRANGNLLHNFGSNLVINPLPSTSFSGFLPQYCTGDPPSTLISNDPAGSGTGFSFYGQLITNGNVLDPSLATNVGFSWIYYTYTDSLGCTNVDSTDVYITALNGIVVVGLDSIYCAGAINPDQMAIFPPNGVLLGNSNLDGFSVNGSDFRFDPRVGAGQRTFTYRYTDPNTNCVSELTQSVTVHPAVVLSYTGINDTAYCQAPDTLVLQGIPQGGTFSGSGVLGNIFNPANAGIGLQQVSYTIDTAFAFVDTTIVCASTYSQDVDILPAPTIGMITPSTFSAFCSNDSSVLLEPTVTNNYDFTFISPTLGAIEIDTIFDTLIYVPYIDPNGQPGVVAVPLYDSVYYFSPSIAGPGIHAVTYRVEDTVQGCFNTFTLTYEVDRFEEARFSLDTNYCESGDSIPLFGLPGGGVFTRNEDTIPSASPFFFISPDYPIPLPATRIDTIIYSVDFGECYDSDTQYVKIWPRPQLSFTDSIANNNTYCLGGDTVQLYPNLLGGTFAGTGVPFDSSIFIPRIPGYHSISYSYTDPTSGCSSVVFDTFSVFGQPKVQFSVTGDCEQDSLWFQPDNQILNLNNIFINQLIDSLTRISWDFGDGVMASGTDTVINDTIRINPIFHVYANPGVHFAKLVVVNRDYCQDSQTVRIVVSQNINNGQFPYAQDFQSPNNFWFAENREPNTPFLWEWGADNNNQGIPAGSNRFWGTKLSGQYDKDEDGWVYSPCFEIDSLLRPMLRFDRWSDTRGGVDGVVLEYRAADGRWKPLGLPNRGINWYRSGIIAGRPGDQDLAPMGWTGQDNRWVDSRYKLDSLDLPNGVLRLRFAFGSPSVGLSTFYDGFAFDNFWIGERTRNVLLETTSNINEPGMPFVNDYIYNLAFHTGINRDVILLQYNSSQPVPNDQFHLHNTSVANARTYYYSITGAGRAAIDGKTENIPPSRYLNSTHFERDMLESPKFNINIDTFYHSSQTAFVQATVTALEDLPSGTYRINTVITEDSLVYNNITGDIVHAVVRADDGSAAQNVMTRTWSVGDLKTVTFSWPHGNLTNTTYNNRTFQAVVFIQAQDSTQRVYQAASSRDVSGYYTNVNEIEAKPELEAISNMRVFPNPAREYFNVQFDEPLEHDYQWRLVDIRGVEVLQGLLEQGSQQLQIDQYDLPSGMYILVVNNDRVFAKRKVIIQRH